MMTDQLAYEIEQMYIEGFKPTTIAATVGCTLELVYEWIEANGVEESDGFLGEHFG